MVGLLMAGILLIILELFVPGGVLGIIGVGMLIGGSYLAFHLPVDNPDLWGFGAVAVSTVSASVVAIAFVRSSYARKLVLAEEISSRSAPEGLSELAGKEGTAHTDLRPSGLADIGGKRVDVVADCAFIPRGSAVKVKKVEGARVLVEPVVSQ